MMINLFPIYMTPGLKESVQHNGRHGPAGYTKCYIGEIKDMMTMNSNSHPWFRRKRITNGP